MKVVFYSFQKLSDGTEVTAARLEKRSRQALHGHQEAAGKQEEGSVHLRISLCEEKG